jgi:hypothetical protein
VVTAGDDVAGVFPSAVLDRNDLARVLGVDPERQVDLDDMFPRISALNIDLLEGPDAEHHGIFLQCLRELELHSSALNARFAVSEKSNRRLGGTRHCWSRQSRIT